MACLLLAVLVGPHTPLDPAGAWVARVAEGRDPDPVDVVDAWHAAWNAGDFDGWAAFLGDDPDDLLGPDLPRTQSPHAALMAAGSRMVRTARCTTIAVTDEEVRLVCPVDVHDAFTSMTVVPVSTELLVDPDGPRRIRLLSNPVDRELVLRAHAAEFRAWVQETHPAVAAAFGLPTIPLQLPNRDDMASAMRLMDEYRRATARFR